MNAEKNLPQKKYSIRSFTLLEMMVATTIALFIAISINQLFSVSSRLIGRSERKTSVTAKARFILDRVSRDFSEMPIGNDLDYQFNESGRTNMLLFFSKIKGPDADRALSIIGYRLEEPQKGCYRLMRGVKGLNWSDSGFMGFQTNGVPVSLSGLSERFVLKNEDYDLLSEDLLKIDISFQQKSDGQLVREAPGKNQGAVLITNIASVVVTLAMLDSTFAAKTTREDLKEFAAKFTLADENKQTFSQWRTNLNAELREANPGLPREVLQNVELFQRFYRIRQ